MCEISICVSTYNRIDYLKETLQTLTTQDFKYRYEVVVVDDGSTDDTKSMVATQFPTVKYFYKTNGGDASAKNLAVEKAQGKYIVFCDSDDLLLPNSLTLLYGKMQKHEDGDFIYSQGIPIDKDGNINEAKRKKDLANYPSGNIFSTLCQKVIVHSCGVLFLREKFLEFGGYNTSYRASHDYLLGLEWAVNNNFYPVATETFKRRRHDSNISNDSYAGYDIMLTMLEEFKANHVDFSPFQKKCIDKRVSDIHIKLAREAKKEQRSKKLIKEHLRKSLKLNFTSKALWRLIFT